MNLLDTDVLIEASRGQGEAADWLSAFGSDEVAAAGIAAIEFIAGSTDKAMIERSHWFLASLQVAWLNPEDNELAYHLARTHGVGSGLGMSDFLIAAQALNQNATLFTFNLKHFKIIPGLNVKEPFSRGE